MSLRNEWRTVKSQMDALAKTHKAAIKSKDLEYLRSSKAFELGFGPLLDAYEKVAEKAEKARPNVSAEQKAVLKAAGLRVMAAGAEYLKVLNATLATAERVQLPAAVVSGVRCMQGTLFRIRNNVNSTIQKCGA